jgi:hypothetical protein
LTNELVYANIKPSKEKKQITGPAADSKNERAVNKGAAKAVN